MWHNDFELILAMSLSLSRLNKSSASGALSSTEHCSLFGSRKILQTQIRRFV